MSDSSSRIRTISPPAELPIMKKNDDWHKTSFFGQTSFNSGLSTREDTFGIKRFDRKQHLYLVGKTGVGKTKLIEQLAQADILLGHGICVIDPHGDLINSLLYHVPKNRIDDVILIDPTDKNYPIAMNPLIKVDPEARHLVTSGLIETFKKQFGDQWSSRIEHVCRFTILALLEYNDATFADIAKILTDPKFRQQVIPHITDDIVRRFWSLEFTSWSERFDNEAIIPLVNRIGQFLSSPLVRNIFSQKQNKIDFDKSINDSKIILVNLSKGFIGEENTELFGSLIITSIHLAIMRRSKIREQDRSNFYLYVDEFQNVATQTFLNLFSESRKFGLNITVAHQHLGQIDKKIQDTIFGNVGTTISFRTGSEDASRLINEFAPICNIEDLLNLGVRDFIIKMSINGTVSEPFFGSTIDVEQLKENFKDEIIKRSRAKYTRNLTEVENELQQDNANTQKQDYKEPIV